MYNKVKIKTKISYRYIPSSKKYEFTAMAAVPADDEGQLPEILRSKNVECFDEILTKTWGYLRDGVLYAYKTMQSDTFDEGEEMAKYYIVHQLDNFKKVAEFNRKKYHLSRYKGQETRFQI